jgi:hypothetical protein
VAVLPQVLVDDVEPAPAQARLRSIQSSLRSAQRARARASGSGSDRTPQHGPANLATIRAAVIGALKDAGCLHIPEGTMSVVTIAESWLASLSGVAFTRGTHQAR